MRRRGQRGTGLLEVMVVAALSALLMAAMMSLWATLMQAQGRILSRGVTERGAQMIGRALRPAVASASYLQLPAVDPDSASTSVLAWFNANPEDGTALDPSRGRGYRFFCLRARLDRAEFLMHEEGDYAGPWPMAAPVCGAPSPGADALVLAGSPGLEIFPRFRRPNGSTLQVDYTLRLALPGRPEQQTAHGTWMGVSEAL